MNDGSNFKIEIKTANVNIYRTYESQNAVNGNSLGMNKTLFVQIYFHAPIATTVL